MQTFLVEVGGKRSNQEDELESLFEWREQTLGDLNYFP